MGNCFHIHKTTSSSSSSHSSAIKHEKVLRVINPGGKILMNFSAGYSTGLSRKQLRDLPGTTTDTIGVSRATSSSVTMNNSKRIKLVITKQELQILLSKKITAEEIRMLSVIKKDDNNDDEDAWRGTNSSSRWRPVLETISEGSELHFTVQ
ncbi:uncharacterized protein LOC8283391 [Ricinus communis]|uniref:uncharacterized protein LOC8283391 n=1 Tax=Ricinus communis TaxID=3988 RepID=UPI00077214E1|nr:uncharacterized protein LOC8283391 [Ricinus communis]|eukprot:XP_015578521.1 uncharacterized protein LOC8283391 [Ricinus communis]